MQANKQYTEARYDERLQAQTLEWMGQHEEHLTHACTFTMEQFDGNLTAEQAWKQWERFCKYLNRKIYGNAAKLHGKTLLILPVLHGEISYKNLHIHAAIGCVDDRSYGFAELKTIIDTAWREMKWAKNDIEIVQYRDINWIDYMLKESVRLDLHSVDLTRCCIAKTLQQ
ncbi:MAG: hypothetical protein COA63_003085 [Methylophaga sp.]|nr:hypothetical protein [Methylophaga sp.]